MLDFLSKPYKNEKRIKALEKELQEMKLEREAMLHDLRFLKNEIHVAVDVNHSKYGRSWAVVCISGKIQDFVYFRELDMSSIREIHEFLRKYNTPNKVVDEPTGIMKRMKF